MSWAVLLKRVFDLDLEHCPNCRRVLKIIAANLEQPVIDKTFTHLGLLAGVPPRAPARGQACRRPDRNQTPPFERPGATAPRVAGIHCARGLQHRGRKGLPVRADLYTDSLMDHRGRSHRLAADHCRP